jgi:hypothetical protein
MSRATMWQKRRMEEWMILFLNSYLFLPSFVGLRRWWPKTVEGRLLKEWRL